MDKKCCKFFAINKCKKGQNCKYLQKIQKIITKVKPENERYMFEGQSMGLNCNVLIDAQTFEAIKIIQKQMKEGIIQIQTDNINNKWESGFQLTSLQELKRKDEEISSEEEKQNKSQEKKIKYTEIKKQKQNLRMEDEKTKNIFYNPKKERKNKKKNLEQIREEKQMIDENSNLNQNKQQLKSNLINPKQTEKRNNNNPQKSKDNKLQWIDTKFLEMQKNQFKQETQYRNNAKQLKLETNNELNSTNDESINKQPSNNNNKQKGLKGKVAEKINEKQVQMFRKHFITSSREQGERNQEMVD